MKYTAVQIEFVSEYHLSIKSQTLILFQNSFHVYALQTASLQKIDKTSVDQVFVRGVTSHKNNGICRFEALGSRLRPDFNVVAIPQFGQIIPIKFSLREDDSRL